MLLGPATLLDGPRDITSLEDTVGAEFVRYQGMALIYVEHAGALARKVYEILCTFSHAD